MFELELLCMDIYTPVVEESCGYQYLSCGESVIGSNVGYPSFAGLDSGKVTTLT